MLCVRCFIRRLDIFPNPVSNYQNRPTVYLFPRSCAPATAKYVGFRSHSSQLPEPKRNYHVTSSLTVRARRNPDGRRPIERPNPQNQSTEKDAKPQTTANLDKPPHAAATVEEEGATVVKEAKSKKSNISIPAIDKPKPKKERWRIQKEALKEKFGDSGWSPRKRLSPDAIEGIRALHTKDPDRFTTPVLAEEFKVSPEAIRRILRSKWKPSAEEMDKRRERWDRRGERIWTQLAELGTRPPKKWREMGIGKADPGEVPKWKRAAHWRQQQEARAEREPILAMAPERPKAPKETFGDRIL